MAVEKTFSILGENLDHDMVQTFSQLIISEFSVLFLSLIGTEYEPSLQLMEIWC